jgi:small-conductance mechanosensitive channel
MKNKSIAVKISNSIDLVKAIKKNKKAAQHKLLKKPLKDMTLELETAAGMQKELKKLKSELKTRKKKLEDQVKKLAESLKEVEKIYRKGKKTAPVMKKAKKPANPPKSKPEASLLRKPKKARPKKKSGIPEKGTIDQ